MSSCIVYFWFMCKHSRVGQIDQIDHDLDHLDPSLPLGFVVQDLSVWYRSNPGNMILDHAEYTAPARQHCPR